MSRDHTHITGHHATHTPTSRVDFLSQIEAPAWMDDGICAQTDPELFYPEKGGSSREAKKICAACPVREQCLEYALSDDRNTYVSPFFYGIWGGHTERERRKLRADRKAGDAS